MDNRFGKSDTKLKPKTHIIFIIEKRFKICIKLFYTMTDINNSLISTKTTCDCLKSDPIYNLAFS